MKRVYRQWIDISGCYEGELLTMELIRFHRAFSVVHANVG